jgi:rsbT co-antagonist protein RsbR
LLGYTQDELNGMPVPQVFSEDDSFIMTLFQACIEQGLWQGELHYRRKDGTTFPAYLSANVLYDEQGVPKDIVGFTRDLTKQKHQEEERAFLQAQIIESQQSSIRELSIPILPLADHVLALPLVGTIDSNRAQHMMELMLENVAIQQADIVIVDITGVKVVDTRVAQALVQAAQAVRLLGANVVLTGIQPQIAQTLVHLGADLSQIVTRRTLQAGIAYALQNSSRRRT